MLDEVNELKAHLEQHKKQTLEEYIEGCKREVVLASKKLKEL